MNKYTRVRQEPTKYDPYNDTEDVYEVNDRGEDYVLKNVNQQNNVLIWIVTWGKCNYKAKKRRSCRRRRSCWRSRQQYLSQYRERWCCWTRSCVRETRTGVTRRWRGRWSKGCPRQSYIGAIEPRYNLRPNGARAGSWKGRSYGLHLTIKRGINKLGATGTKAIIKELS